MITVQKPNREQFNLANLQQMIEQQQATIDYLLSISNNNKVAEQEEEQE